MATEGRSGLGRALLGSVAERVVRHAPCATLVVRAAPADRLFAKVLCAVDFSPASRIAMRRAAAFARALDASLTLLYVQTNPTLFCEQGTARADMEPSAREAHTSLDEWRAEATTLRGAAVEALYEQGQAWPTIVGQKEARGAELIVTGTQGRSWIAQAVIGSVAERVVRHAGCSVLVVPDRAGG